MDFGKRHGTASFFTLTSSMQGFDGQCDALTAANAKRDKAARQTVAAHRVDELGCEHSTGRADRMTVGHGAAFDVDDVLGQPELASDNDGNGCEGWRVTYPRENLARCGAQFGRINRSVRKDQPCGASFFIK
jgi:hypothetical protein